MSRVLDYLDGVLFRGMPRTRTGEFAGRDTLPAGSKTVVISTSFVESDSIIEMALEQNTDQNSGGQPVVVKTISPKGYFEVGTADGNAFGSDATIMWRIIGQ